MSYRNTGISTFHYTDQGNPDLHGWKILVDIIEQAQCYFGIPVPFWVFSFNRGAFRCEQRNFTQHEQAVQDNEDDYN